MNTPTVPQNQYPSSDEPRGFFAGMVADWNAFFFTPKDPTILGVMRVLVGMVTLYTFFVHSLTLPEFMGENAWCDFSYRREIVADRPILITPLLSSPLHGGQVPGRGPENAQQERWAEEYKNAFAVIPPSPHPTTDEQAKFAFDFRNRWNFDFRYYGLSFPKDKREHDILAEYVANHGATFPPPYPKNDAEVKEIEDYITRHGQDPRLLYSRGTPVFSVWLDVIDPVWMQVIQTGFVLAAVCFVLGLGTRITSVIVWFANLCYIHRNPHVLFGVDTMMNVLLLYLMIGPSGAAVSLDRLIARWWNKGNLSATPTPRVSANLAVRLMQIHLCIIYFISGISKLQGNSWWQGTAVWSVLGNYEFAPMNFPLYINALRFFGEYQIVFETLITGACISTVAFEIGYPFLIWRPKTRAVFLAGAVFLHGFIGLFMGLKTFSLVMLVFNMAFLKDREIAAIFHWLNSEPASLDGDIPKARTRKTAEMAAK